MYGRLAKRFVCHVPQGWTLVMILHLEQIETGDKWKYYCIYACTIERHYKYTIQSYPLFLLLAPCCTYFQISIMTFMGEKEGRFLKKGKFVIL